MDQEPRGAVGEVAETIDLAFGAGLRRNDRIAQGVTGNEVLGQLVERPIESVLSRDCLSWTPIRTFRLSHR